MVTDAGFDRVLTELQPRTMTDDRQDGRQMDHGRKKA